MKVILLKDVQKIGKKYDIKEVADGFALNKLIPQGSAKVASPEEVKKVLALKAILDADRKVQEDLIQKDLGQVNSKEVSIKAKVNAKGHLFAQLHVDELARAIKESLGVTILPEFIVIPKPIKEIGAHDITIKVGDKKAILKLVVEGTK